MSFKEREKWDKAIKGKNKKEGGMNVEEMKHIVAGSSGMNRKELQSELKKIIKRMEMFEKVAFNKRPCKYPRKNLKNCNVEKLQQIANRHKKHCPSIYVGDDKKRLIEAIKNCYVEKK